MIIYEVDNNFIFHAVIPMWVSVSTYAEKELFTYKTLDETHKT